MKDWLPALTAWGAAILAGSFTIIQFLRSYKKDIEKELNLHRLNFYPEIQQFMSAIYNKSGGGWSEAMKEEGRLEKMMELTNKLILWASNDTLAAWSRLVDEGQRGDLITVGRLALLWAELDISMRKDIGYGVKMKPEQLFPILFSPKTVDKIKSQISEQL